MSDQLRTTLSKGVMLCFNHNSMHESLILFFWLTRCAGSVVASRSLVSGPNAYGCSSKRLIRPECYTVSVRDKMRTDDRIRIQPNENWLFAAVIHCYPSTLASLDLRVARVKTGEMSVDLEDCI